MCSKEFYQLLKSYEGYEDPKHALTSLLCQLSLIERRHPNGVNIEALRRAYEGCSRAVDLLLYAQELEREFSTLLCYQSGKQIVQQVMEEESNSG